MRTLKKNILVLFTSCIVVLILFEIIIRLFPHKFTLYLRSCCDVVFNKDKDIGQISFPGQKATTCRDCYRIYPVEINSLGFRDEEWQENKEDFKIAILGDSIMIAQEVSQGDYTAAILKKILHKEVFNAAIGGIGTLAELAVYKKFLRPFKPNIVILFFTKANDVHDNSCALSKMLLYDKIQPCGYIVDDKIRIDTNFELSQPLGRQDLYCRVKDFIKKHCWSCAVINRFISRRLCGVLFRVDLRKRMLCYWDVYVPAKTKVWQDAWKITESALADLKREIGADGGNLLVVSSCEYINISKTWEREFKRETGLSKIPKDFDPLYPTKRLREICSKYNIALLEMDPYFLQYRDKFHLSYPYFSYWCDGHYSPLGHFLIAHVVARYLIEENWIPLRDKEKGGLLKKISKNLNLSPWEILGKEGYRQIYKRRLYLGSSSISRIMQEQ